MTVNFSTNARSAAEHTSTVALAVQHVSHSFGSLLVLDNLDFDVHWGEFLAIVGPSGCGKTTLLDILAGHLAPSNGTVRSSGKARTIYQQGGLFPWLTVEENIAMGLRSLAAGQSRAQVLELLQLIRLEGFAAHYPHQLSGGMRQRVELARAMAGDSDILLMDEPFTALDYQTRLRMRRELVRLLKARPRTVVLVTHDIEEASELADRVIVLSDRPGRIRYEHIIDVDRPRDLTNEKVLSAIEAILAELGLAGELVEDPA